MIYGLGLGVGILHPKQAHRSFLRLARDLILSLSINPRNLGN